jgi:PBP1b-binding outer membrane lipoprotein LpoB
MKRLLLVLFGSALLAGCTSTVVSTTASTWSTTPTAVTDANVETIEMFNDAVVPPQAP